MNWNQQFSVFKAWRLSLLLLLFFSRSNAQFIINGTAAKVNVSEYLLTPSQGGKVGSIWFQDKISLHESFELNFELYFGTRDNGADGIAFGLQPLSTSIGQRGAGMGIGGVSPSFFVEFDTYRNGREPSYDHIALQKNGDVNNFGANNLAGPTYIKNGVSNVENGQWFPVRVSWNAPTKTFQVYVDCDLRLTLTEDVVQTIFNNDPNVFWGFSAATGGAYNQHKIRNITSTLYTIPDNSICKGESVQIELSPTSSSFSWTPTTGVSDLNSLTPTLNPQATTEYIIAYGGQCNTVIRDTFLVEVNDVYVDLGSDTSVCLEEPFDINSQTNGETFNWSNGSGNQNISVNTAGTYTLQVSKNGCSTQDQIVISEGDCGCANDIDGDEICDEVDLDNDNDGILDVDECMTSNFQWSAPPQVNGNVATGVINGVGYTYTSSINIETTPTIFAYNRFPTSFNIPNTTVIKNRFKSTNTIIFDQPVLNPTLMFSSIGGGPTVPIQFSNPVDVLFKDGPVTIDSPTQITGKEGYVVLRMNGTFTEISFDYLADENYVNFTFGADFATFCDTDGDGTADYLDLDSDNDGCFDALEGGSGFQLTDLTGGVVNGPVDASGVPIAANGGQAKGSSSDGTVLAQVCIPPVDTTYICKGESVLIEKENVTLADWSGMEPFEIITEGSINATPSNTTTYYVTTYTKVENMLVNGDFEQPYRNSFGVISDATVPGWSTTASDRKMEFWNDGFLGTPSYSGDQFVELNANMPAALFQDMATTPGDKLVWGFAHRGRSGVESMHFEVGPPGGPYERIETVSTGKEWVYYNGVYEVPAGQTTTRFYYSSAMSGASGNLMDAVEFFTLEERVDSFVVVVNDVPSINLQEDTLICYGENINLLAGHANENAYLWNDGSSNHQLTVNSEGLYTVSVMNDLGCSSRDSMRLSIDYDCNKSLCGQDVNYNTWSQKGFVDFGDWQVAADGKSVTQNINSEPTFYVDNQDHINVRFSGEMSVTPFDDDWIGMVFGFESPEGLVSSYPFQMKTTVFAWKQSHQIWNGQEWFEGFSLFQVDKQINNATELSNLFRNHTGNANEINVLATNYNSVGSTGLGWKDNTNHVIEVDYLSSKIIIRIDGEEVINVDGCFDAGKIGFYNDSQGGVTYSNFKYQYMADLQSSKDTLCAGEDVVFSLNGGAVCPNYDYYPEGTTFNWDLGDGETKNQKDSIPHQFITPGVYTVNLTLTDEFECTISATKEITVGGDPVFDLGKDTLVCEGDSVELNPNIDNVYYSWSNGVETKGLIINGPGLYHLIVSDSIGCSSEDSIEISFQPLPRFNLGSDSTICAGDSISLAPISKISGEYTWNTGENQNEINVNIPGTYQLQVKDEWGCVFEDSMILTVLDKPIVDLGEDTIICFGQEVVFDAQNQGMKFLWNNGSRNQKLTSSSTGEYSVTVSNSIGCSSSDTIDLQVNELPVVDLGLDQKICLGQSITLDAGNESLNHLWNTGLTNQTITINESGIYGVEVRDEIGCLGSDSMELTVNPLPEVDLGNDTAICIGESVTLNAGNPGFNYLWNTGATTEGLTINTGGDFEVRVYDEIGCADTASMHLQVNELPVINLGADTVICAYQSVLLNAGNEGLNFIWNTGAKSQELEVDQTGLYAVEVRDSIGCLGTDDIYITKEIIEDPYFEKEKIVCEGTSVVLEPDFYKNYVINWEADASNSIIEVSETGSYISYVESPYCKDTFNVNVQKIDTPEAIIVDLGGRDNYCFELENTSLRVSSPGTGVTFNWDDFGRYKDVEIDKQGTYALTASNNHCSSRYDYKVNEYCKGKLFIPNAFTPNNDGKNDVFRPVLFNVSNYELFIFNRWGDLIFQTTDPEEGWDGTFNGNIVQFDVYTYKLTYDYITEHDGLKHKMLTGIVTPLR